MLAPVRPRSLLLGALLLLVPSPAVARPLVAGFERFGDKAGARGGRLLLTELACVRCHAPAAAAAVPRQGPALDDVGSRVRVSYLRKFLRDPQATKPGTTMPHILGDGPDKEQKVEALVQLMASTGSLKQERPQPKFIAAGRDLYHKVGCVACHGTRTAKGEQEKVLPTSVPLGDLKAKYSITSLTIFLENPLHARPSGRMPRILNTKEAREVANYLLQGIKVDVPAGKGSANYAYYEGNWGKVPDFAKLKPRATGVTTGLDVGVAQRGSNYALKFEAVLPVEREATYSFSLTSDDGSRLWVDGKLVVDNDGVHPPTTRGGSVKLSKGIHKVVIGFFQAGGGAELSATVGAPGLGQHDLADLLAASKEALVKKKPEKKAPTEDDINITAEFVKKGVDLFGTLGCASCHQLKVGPQPIASRLKARPLAELKGDGGCLADRPAKGLPWYGLGKDQRRAVEKALATKALPPTPALRVAETMTALNCYACHSRNKVGGPEDELNKSFLTTQPEMGDEGRVPPPLDGVGAKLRLDYLLQLLAQGGHDRPYMHTRMPGFGPAAAHLPNLFEGLDSLPKVAEVHFKAPLNRVKSQARTLVGAQAFGCIKCHTFAGHKAEGVQGIDMLRMPQRLRRDWFHAYITDPQKIRPGTRMPSGFIEGKSVLPEILDGTPLTQIEAMWVYLQDGTKARLPVGTKQHSIPLVPKDGAILYRNFIDGAGPRAIAVGYPELAHLAFDANDLRLALIWHGAFIDAARHWSGRGEGFEGPLGDNVVRLHAGAPFAHLAKATDPWPAGPAKARGYRFRGYKLTPDDRPTFLYSYGDVRFEDFPNAKSKGKDVVVLERTVTATAPGAVTDLYFRAAVGDSIVRQADGSYRVDNTWALKVNGAAAQVRKSGGKTELLVPLRFADGKARLALEYVW